MPTALPHFSNLRRSQRNCVQPIPTLKLQQNLRQNHTPARKMRAALALFLFLGSATSLVWQFWFDVMNLQAIWRGLVFSIPAIAGVWAGMKLFTPRFEPYYRPFCLTLLCGLSAFGLLRLSLS